MPTARPGEPRCRGVSRARSCLLPTVIDARRTLKVALVTSSPETDSEPDTSFVCPTTVPGKNTTVSPSLNPAKDPGPTSQTPSRGPAGSDLVGFLVLHEQFRLVWGGLRCLRGRRCPHLLVVPHGRARSRIVLNFTDLELDIGVLSVRSDDPVWPNIGRRPRGPRPGSGPHLCP